MKKVISSIVLIFICLYGFSVNPVDPPAKTGDEANPFVLPVTSENDECSEMMAEVPVTVIVTFTDCPHYDCEEPFGCLVEVVIYQFGYEVDRQEWDPDVCQYTFEDIRADEGSTFYGRLEVYPTGCISAYNDGYFNTGTVPLGGGDVYGSTTYCK